MNVYNYWSWLPSHTQSYCTNSSSEIIIICCQYYLWLWYLTSSLRADCIFVLFSSITAVLCSYNSSSGRQEKVPQLLPHCPLRQRCEPRCSKVPQLLQLEPCGDTHTRCSEVLRGQYLLSITYSLLQEALGKALELVWVVAVEIYMNDSFKYIYYIGFI